MKYYKLFFFILVPFLLILPLFHMSTEEITEQENRTLAKFPATTKKDKPNYEFGKEFESWLGDRFWGRDQLIDVRFQTMYKINGRIENDKAFVGDDGWMFMKRSIEGIPSLEKQRKKIEKTANLLKRFDNKFKEKNISIYFLILPSRTPLYQKYWERYYIPKPRLNYNDELIKALLDHPNIHIIYPKQKFIEASKNEDLFYKTDEHFNKTVAKIMHESLFTSIKENFFKNKNIKYEEHYRQKNRNSIGATLNLPATKIEDDIFLDEINFTPNLKYDIIQQKNIILNENWPQLEITKAKTPYIKNNVFVIGRCYGYQLNWLFAPIFQNTYYFRDILCDSLKEYFNKYFLPNIKSGDIIIIASGLEDKTSIPFLADML